MKARRFALGAGLLLLLGAAATTMWSLRADAGQGFYKVKFLVSDEPGVAPHTDPSPINAWGIAFPPRGNVVVANAETDTATRHDGHGNPMLPVIDVDIEPTGVVYNATQSFEIGSCDERPAQLLFAGEEGKIAAFSPDVDPDEAEIVIDNSVDLAVYKGIAIANDGSQDLLFATDFHNFRVDVFDSHFDAVTTVGGFRDPTLPAGYSPFGIRNIGGALFVTFAVKPPSSDDDQAGPGLGLVDIFLANGIFVRRLVEPGHELNAPWGLALAPRGFGPFSRDLLVGNFGDGTIAAYDIPTGQFKGRLSGADGHPLEIDGLWGIEFGNGTNRQPKNVLFFAAGPDDEEHGLYGKITLKQ